MCSHCYPASCCSPYSYYSPYSYSYLYSPPKPSSLEDYYASYAYKPYVPSYLYPRSFGGSANWYTPPWLGDTTTSVRVPDYQRTCTGDRFGDNAGGGCSARADSRQVCVPRPRV